MIGLSLGLACTTGCITCRQAYPVIDEEVEANKLEFRKNPSLEICPRCFCSVTDLVDVSEPGYRRRWKKAASRFFRQFINSLTS